MRKGEMVSKRLWMVQECTVRTGFRVDLPGPDYRALESTLVEP